MISSAVSFIPPTAVRKVSANLIYFVVHRLEAVTFTTREYRYLYQLLESNTKYRLCTTGFAFSPVYFFRCAAVATLQYYPFLVIKSIVKGWTEVVVLLVRHDDQRSPKQIEHYHHQYQRNHHHRSLELGSHFGNYKKAIVQQNSHPLFNKIPSLN